MKNLFGLLLLSICLGFCSLALAQKKPMALKFDEFNDDNSETQFYPYEEITLSQRINRFIEQIKRERKIKVYLIYYQARIENQLNLHKSSNWASETQSQINHKTRLKYEDVISIDGGYKERNTLEYWIAPENAEPPKPSSDFDKSETFVCQSIDVFADNLQFDKSKLIEFFVFNYYLIELKNLNFNWKVSAGEIIEGQGTASIKVRVNDNSVNRITAYAEVSGLPYPCPKVGFKTIDVNKKSYQAISSERYNYSELSARVDHIMSQLANAPSQQAYIILYASRAGGIKEMARTMRSLRNIFAFRRYDMSRVTIIDGGYRENDAVDMWILPDGAEPPKPIPTVDRKFVNLPKRVKRKSS